MSTQVKALRDTGDTVAGALPRWAWRLIFFVAAVFFPYITGGGDFLDASIQTLAYVIMALGLNIVVGFAGLLDLGYVAFYAIGAFVIGWFGSQQFPDVNGGKGIHILVSDRSTFQPKLSGGRLDIAGIHINFFIVIFIAMAITAAWGVLLGAPTLRLRGDYLAIVTLAFGEIVPRIFENSTSGLFGIGSTDFSHGRQGITPIDTINLPWSHDVALHGRQLETRVLGGLGDGACSRSSSTAACATRGWAARGSPSARTRSRPRRWASTSCGPSCGPTRWAPRSAASRACSWGPTTTRSTSTSSSSGSRCSSWRWSSSAAWATSGASSSAPSRCR